MRLRRRVLWAFGFIILFVIGCILVSVRMLLGSHSTKQTARSSFQREMIENQRNNRSVSTSSTRNRVMGKGYSEHDNLRSDSTEISPKVNDHVHAFYYPWYASKSFNGEWSHWNHITIPHWKDNVNKLYPKKQHIPPNDIAARFYPELGPYASNDPKVIEAHMQQFVQAGIGVISLSWYPPHTKDDNAILFVDNFVDSIMDIAEMYALKVCFHIEPYKDRTAYSIREDIKYIIDTYGQKPAFYFYLDKPLFYIYDSYTIDPSEWKKLLLPKGEITIRDTEYDSIMIGLFVESSHCSSLRVSGFNGFYTYFAATGFVYGSNPMNWKTMASCAEGMQRPSLFIPSVGPGYDDSPVRPWNGVNTRPRENGAYYKRMWEMALSVNPRIISITSFNEWHEGSQIESAVQKDGYEDYGKDSAFYLDLTKRLISHSNLCI